MANLNIEALYTDDGGSFRVPQDAEPGDSVLFRFRTLKGNADGIFFVILGDGGPKERPMQLEQSDGRFDYYSIRLTAEETPLRYVFRIACGDESLFYGKRGVTEKPEEDAYCMVPGFLVPEWAKGAVIYQIYTDRFRNGNPANDVVTNEYIYLEEPVKHVEDWNACPEEMDVRRFYGGDLSGILEKLDYLKDLGVEVIYLNPVFVSPSNHKYDTQDYEHVDPHLTDIVVDADGILAPGDMDNRHADKYITRTTDLRNLRAANRFFADFIAKIHAKGMKVIIDGVFNHCGSFNGWLDRERIYEKHGGYPVGAYISENSPYRDYFRFADLRAWPENKSFEGWWGMKTLPKLNYEDSEALYQYIMDIGRKWVSPPYCADGWRLDVAADVGFTPWMNHRFWKDFRKAVKAANPEAVLIAEHYGDPSEWLRGDQWDSVMNYDAFMEPVSWFLTGMEKHSDAENANLRGDGRAFFNAMRNNMAKLPGPSLESAMNQLSNHDHSRFMTRTNRTVGRLATKGSKAASSEINYGIFRQGLVMLMTWPGCPTYYYGDETGMCGWTDPDSRRSFPWGHEDLELIEFCHILAMLRRELPALRRGSLIELCSTSTAIAYGRFLLGDAPSRCIVAVNAGERPVDLRIPLWKIGFTDKDVLRRRMLTYESGYNVGILEYQQEDGYYTFPLPPVSSVILDIQSRESLFSPTVLSGEWVDRHNRR